jgi:hypothetical protein
MNDLIERLKAWSDSYHKCTICERLEPSCDCVDVHPVDENGHGANWKSTPESDIFDEAIAAIELLHKYVLRVCPNCDNCGVLLLEGGFVESDGLHGKPARIVCPICHKANLMPDMIEESKSYTVENWLPMEGIDVDEIFNALTVGLVHKNDRR